MSLIKVRMSLNKVAEVSWRSMVLVRSGAESHCNTVPLSSADFYHQFYCDRQNSTHGQRWPAKKQSCSGSSQGGQEVARQEGLRRLWPCGSRQPEVARCWPGGSQEVGSQEASRGSQVAAKSWPVKSGPAAARGQPPKRQLPPKQQTRGQVLVPRAVAKWQPEVAPSQAVAKRPRSLILKWLINMLTG